MATFNGKEADYIVIGAGSAGCAGKPLSQTATIGCFCWKPGQDKNFFIHMPAGYARLVPQANPSNYAYETEPEANVGGRPDVLATWTWLGRIVFDQRQAYPGHAADYERWSQEGNAGWSYADVLPYLNERNLLKAAVMMPTTATAGHLA